MVRRLPRRRQRLLPYRLLLPQQHPQRDKRLPELAAMSGGPTRPLTRPTASRQHRSSWRQRKDIQLFSLFRGRSIELRPLLISTRPERNAGLFEEGLKPLQTSWCLAGLKRACILAMTDALGAWLLSDPVQRYAVLSQIRSHIEFVDLIEGERAAGRIRRDDTTLLVVK